MTRKGRTIGAALSLGAALGASAVSAGPAPRTQPASAPRPISAAQPAHAALGLGPAGPALQAALPPSPSAPAPASPAIPGIGELRVVSALQPGWPEPSAPSPGPSLPKPTLEPGAPVWVRRRDPSRWPMWHRAVVRGYAREEGVPYLLARAWGEGPDGFFLVWDARVRLDIPWDNEVLARPERDEWLPHPGGQSIPPSVPEIPPGQPLWVRNAELGRSAWHRGVFEGFVEDMENPVLKVRAWAYTPLGFRVALLELPLDTWAEHARLRPERDSHVPEPGDARGPDSAPTLQPGDALWVRWRKPGPPPPHPGDSLAGRLYDPEPFPWYRGVVEDIREGGGGLLMDVRFRGYGQDAATQRHTELRVDLPWAERAQPRLEEAE